MSKAKAKYGVKSRFTSGNVPSIVGTLASASTDKTTGAINIDYDKDTFVDAMMRNYRILEKITKLRNAARAIGSRAAETAINDHEDLVRKYFAEIYPNFKSVVISKYAAGIPTDTAYTESFKAIASLAASQYERAKQEKPLTAIASALSSPQTSI